MQRCELPPDVGTVVMTNERHAFGKPLRSFGQIQRYIARSYASWKSSTVRASAKPHRPTTAGLPSSGG